MEIENKYAKFYTRDGYLHFIYKPNVFIDLAAAKQIVSDRLKAQSGKPYRVICDIKGIKNAEKAARDYLAKEGSKDVIAVGLLVDSIPLKLMTNFYLAVTRPSVPTKMFSTEEEAKKFLDKFQ